MPKILLVEDDLDLAGSLVDWLQFEHHTVEHCANGREALEHLKFFEYDIVILDWNLPEIEGPDILKQYRDWGGATPVIMLTGRSGTSEIETGFGKGADDYVAKPCDARVLSARIKAILRRQTKNYAESLKIRDVEIDATRHRVTKNGAEVKLQPKEFAVLEFLVRHPNEAFSVDSLLSRIWDSDSEASPDTVRVCITRLRNKIDTADQPSIIRTVHRIGYQIDM